jgi:hypothetical protein
MSYEEEDTCHMCVRESGLIRYMCTSNKSICAPGSCVHVTCILCVLLHTLPEAQSGSTCAPGSAIQ